MNVLDLLARDGGDGLVIHPQLRQKCPLCIGNHSLSVPNEEYSKCFRCGKFWSTASVDQTSFWASYVLGKLATACCETIADHEESHEVWNYLLERKIEPGVIHTGPIGVVPHHYDVVMLQSILKTTYDGIKVTPPDKPAGRTAQEIMDWQLLKAQAKRDEDIFTKLKEGFEILSGTAGWLAFFYSNKDGFCSVKLRDLKTKDFRMIGWGGVFWPEREECGYSETWRELLDTVDDDIAPNFLAFEGEFNLLQWHSALYRVDEALGRQWVPNPSCALGGSNSWDTKALLALSRDPVINADNDVPGVDAVKKSVKDGKTPLRYFTLTNVKDMDELLKDAPTETVIDLLLAELPHVKWMCRELDDVRDEINETLGDKTDRLNTQDAVKIIWRDLTSRGKFYWNRISDEVLRCYFWHRESKALVVVEKDHKSYWWRTYLSQYGIMSRETFAKQMISTIMERSSIEGRETQIHSMAYYDRETNSSYVYLGANRLAVITEDDIEVSFNGRDGVLFRNETMDKDPVKLKLEEIERPRSVLGGTSPFTRMIGRSNLSEHGVIPKDGYRHVLAGRVMSLFFPQLVGEKAIVAVIGEYKSGKTEVVRQIGLTLFGKDYKVVITSQQDRRNIEALLSTREFVLLDNLDEEVEPEVLNLLAVAVTGGMISLRKLYSDGETIDLPLVANLFITAQTMPWTRGDVLSRTIKIPVDKLPVDIMVSSDELKRRVLSERNAVFTDLLSRVQLALKIIPELGSYPTEFRVQGLSNFIIGLSDNKELVRGWFNALADDDKQQNRSESSVYDRLQEIIGKHAKVIRGRQNEGLPWSMGLRALVTLMDEGMPIAHRVRSQQAVVRFIKQEATMLAEIGFSRDWDSVVKTWRFNFNPTDHIIRRCELLVRGEGSLGQVQEETGTEMTW